VVNTPGVHFIARTSTFTCAPTEASNEYTYDIPLTVVGFPTVNAGPEITDICQGDVTDSLGGIVGGGAMQGTWASSQGGTFSPSASTLNSSWIPPASYSGTTTLTLTTLSVPPCSEVSASKTVTVLANPIPIVVQNEETLYVINGPFSSYQWFRNGVIVSGAVLDYYTPELSGNFTVQVQNSNGCTNNSEIIDLNVGISIIQSSYKLFIFPNPSNGQFLIEADFKVSTDVTIVVRDIFGRELVQPEIIKDITSLHKLFDLSHLSDGVYYIHVDGSEGLAVKPLVKN
jgi:hypothetical protein